MDQMTIYERMASVLGELPAIGKDAYNQQQSFHYRSHDDVLNALNPLLARWGVFVVPEVLERVTSERKTRQGHTLYEVNLHVQYTFYGLEGDFVKASAWGEGTDSGDKSTNKAMTMAFKNVLAQSFAVSTADTIDADSQSPEDTVGRTGGAGAASHELEQLIEEIKAIDPDSAHGGNYWYQVAVNAAARYHNKALEDLAEGELGDLLRRFREHRDKLLAERGGGELPIEETLVREGPASFPTPTNWAEVEAAIRAYGDESWEDFQRFALQAKEQLFPDAARMSPQRKAVLLQKAAGVVCALRDAHDPGEFPPPVRIELQAHWAKVLGGSVLPGPEWAMDPSEAEAGRPARPKPVEGSGEATTEAPTSSSTAGEPSPDSPTDASPEQPFTDSPLTDGEQQVLDAARQEFNDPPLVEDETRA